MATLRDVAAAAGVSVATASYVFNRRGRVSPAVRQRVLSVARELGYAGPNPSAAILRRGSTGILGVVFGEGLSHNLDDPAASAFLAGVSDVAEAEDMALTLLPVPPIEADRRRPGLAALERAVIDGALLYSLEEDHHALPILLERGMPLVAVDSPATVSGPPWVCVVRVTDRSAAEAAAQHVIDLGHRRAAVLVDRLGGKRKVGQFSWTTARRAPNAVLRDRLGGYLDTWRRTLEPSDLTLYECGSGLATDAQQVAADFLARHPRPTAVLTTSDLLAVGVCRAARAAGLAVPRDLSVVGFDDSPIAPAHDPALTTVRQPLREKGRRAARALLDHLAGAPVTDSLLSAELVVRESTAPPPGG